MMDRRSWSQSFAALVHPRAVTMLFLGFSAGLPLLLIFGTLSVWLREAGVERATITFFSWAAIGFSFKFVWAPLVDRLPIPWLTAALGRRRAWLLAAQFAVVAALLWTSSFDPQVSLTMTAIGALAIGFTAATQDIVIDAYRIESAEPDLQSLLAAMYIAGYRLAMIVAGAGSLWLAHLWGDGGYQFEVWSQVYRVMALAMLVGITTTLIISEPTTRDTAAGVFRGTADYVRFLVAFALAALTFVYVFLGSSVPAGTIREMLSAMAASSLAGFVAESVRFATAAAAAAMVAWGAMKVGLVSRSHVQVTYVDPIADFVARYGKTAILLIVLIGTYRIADIVMGAIANVFYLDQGYDKSQIATYSKFWGLWATIAGGFAGGVLAMRYGVHRALFLGAALAAASNLLFAYLAVQAPAAWLLGAVVAADNLSAGLAGAAFVAFLSSLTNVSFTAMQYALFTSIMLLFPKVLAGYSGTMVDSIGYPFFFIGTAILGIPVLVLVWLAGRLVPDPVVAPGEESPVSRGMERSSTG